ncbi:uncharacterized protein [Zea mays]|uniref:OSJNBa0041A02.21-like protein n=1 Tax=Zea mays TaxID=4577 RepID=A0A1D6H264_MAIZE|nr:uncharacterized protein LOC103626687 [Zea mays]AQK68952.1 OSJNBa0041A02.21-like protein [Zea mays]|eukprot:XP_008645305.1 uncharacterized protein LOC103626687 [Zea mays]
MAWWRARVVAPARHAWLAVVVAARVRGRKRRTERAGIVDLHKDVQTCGYHDVQVMWGMLGLEAGAPSAPERRKRSPFWTWTPSFWHFASSRRTGTAAAR